MSSTIDEKVVEMRFNNQDFETGAKQTLSTIDKLKTAFNFGGVTKGLDSVKTAANGISFAGLQNGAEIVSSKMSALGIMGVTALVNIANQAVNTGKSIVNALAIKPVTTGLSEYETKLNAIQTILANTKDKGTTLEDVNKTLNDLNRYADKTIYNFQQMTSSIGQFTTAGVDLETSASSIKGIANLAAFVGAPASDASRAMFQLSQALSTGKVRLTDWMSLEHTAGMGGKAFQDALIRTARVLKDSNVNVDDAIKKHGNFRDSLKEDWLTTNVLTETLKQFAGEVDEATLKQQGFTNEQIKQIQETAKLAEENATVVKTFSQLKETLGEAAQSGWAETWEIIFGDLDEARALWTGVNNVISGIIDDSARARNEMLKVWKENGGRDAIIDSIKNLWQYATDIVGPVQEVFRNIFPPITGERLAEISKKLLEFTKTLEFTEAKALPLQSIAASIFKTIRNGLNFVISAFNVAKTIVGAGIDAFNHIFPTDGIIKRVKDFGRAISQLKPTLSISEVTARKLHYIFRGLFSVIDIGIQTIKAVYSVAQPLISKFLQPFKSVTDALPKTGQSLLDYFYHLSLSVTRLASTWKKNDTIRTTLQSWYDAAKTKLQPIINIFVGVKNAIESIFKSITGLSFGDAFTAVVDTMRSAFDNIVSFVSGLANGNKIDFGAIWQNITTAVGPLGSVLNVLKSFVKALGDIFVSGAPLLSRIIEGAGTLLGGVLSAISNAFGSVEFTNMVNLINAGLLLGVTGGLKKFVGSLNEIIGVFKGGGEGGIFEKIFGGKLGDMFGDTFKPIQDTLYNMQTKLKADSLKQIAIAIGLLTASIWVLSGIDPDQLGASLTAAAIGLGELVGALYIINKYIGGSKANDMKKLATNMILVAAAVAILSIGIKNLAGLSWSELAVGLAGVFGALVMLGGFLTATDFSQIGIKMGIGLVLIAVAINKISEAVISLSKLSFDQISQGILGLFGTLTLFGAFLTFTDFSGIGIRTGIGLIAIAVAIGMLAKAGNTFGTMDFGVMVQGLIGLGGALLGLGIFTTMVSGSTNLISIGIGLIAVAAAMTILSGAIQTMGQMDQSQMVQGLIGLGAALLSLAIALNFMPKDTLALGVGLLMVGAGIKMVASAVATMGSMDTGQLVQGVVALGASLVGLALGLNLMTGALPGAAALLIASAALLMLGPALLMFKAVGNNCVPIFTALAGAFIVLAAGAAIIAPALIPLAGFAAVLLGLSVAGAACGAALIVLGIGLSAVGAGIAGLVAGLVSAIQGIADLGTNLLQGITNIFVNGWNDLKPVLQSFCDAFINFFKSIFGIHSPSTVMAEMGMNLIAGLGQGISNAVGTALNAISGIGTAIIEHVLGFGERFISSGQGLIDSLGSGISSKVAEAKAKMGEVGEGILIKIDTYKTRLLSAGRSAIGSFVSGMGEKLSAAREKATSIARSALEAIKGVSFHGAGEDAGQGFINGLGSKISGVINKAAELAKSALSTVTNTIKSGSPSKETRKYGQWFGQGFIIGIGEYVKAAGSASEELAHNALSVVDDLVGRTQDTIDDVFDFDPVITPVLNLDTLKKQSQSVSRLINHTTANLGLSAPEDKKSNQNNGSRLPVVNNNTTYVQNITSPRPLRSRDIYRQTKNLIAIQKGVRA